jgi:ribulose-5-phosphate 4-epimerase/fuculose-1-phosphate aldolase
MSAPTTKLRPAVRPVREQVSEEEWRTRVDLAACYRLVAHYGWDDLIFTHISARVPGGHEHFLINPYGMMFHEITASSLVKVDLEGAIVMPTDYAINPAGFTIHSAIHAARKDVGCVLHLHTRDGVAVSAMAEGLLPLSQTAMIARVSMAYHDYEGIALDHDERTRLVHDLADRMMMILRNHGTLAVGPDVAEAFLRMFFLERACSMQVAALSGGRPLTMPGDAVQLVVAKQVFMGAAAGEKPGALAWPGLLRLLDSRDASFRN